ncbi:MAG: AAA family ATPase [Deltaproteobacteria bacterium]|nr:AAA family ATPase [Deltaproteobacteria bacterium]
MELPEVIKALLNPAAYPEKPPGVELRQTHISYLFFTPEFVYKVKKPVNFGFLDFTTLRKRRFYCEQEVTLNGRLAEDVYIEVVAIKKGKGGIGVGGEGRTVEYAVKMKRLPHEMMLNEMLEDSRITDEMVREIGRVIGRFHLKIPSTSEISRFGLPDLLTKNTEENFSQTKKYRARTVSSEQFERIEDFTRGMLEKREGLFNKRVEGGYIKELHGDLHADHVCITDSIKIFDCIEFNERFRYSDVVSDMAFLAMDFDCYNRHDLSRLFGLAYFETTEDPLGKELLNFYKCYRAYVRGKVESFKLDEEEVSDEEKEVSRLHAMRYFHLADLYATGGFRPTVIVVCGLTGTGKTTVAAALSRKLGVGLHSSDVVRKELAGIEPEERRLDRFEEGIYRSAFTEQTYAELIRRGRTSLQEGRSIILDATFSRAAHREAVVKVAKEAGANLHFIECTACEDVIKVRLEKRLGEKGAVSDGRWEIYERQRGICEKIDEPHVTVDTSKPIEESLFRLLAVILG